MPDMLFRETEKGMNVFDRYAPFVQDFIYRHQWEALRAVQAAAADVLFNTDENLLLCSGTASGKTETRQISPEEGKFESENETREIPKLP